MYEPYQRPPAKQIDEAIVLWRLGLPNPRIRTRKAQELLHRYKAAIRGIEGSDHPYDDVILTELRYARDHLTEIIAKRSDRRV